MKTVYLLAAAAAALTSTIGMARAGEQKFVHDGETYVYTSSADKSGMQVIDGRRYPSGGSFHLVVRDGRVSGTSGGVPVTFKVEQAVGAASGVEVAAR